MFLITFFDILISVPCFFSLEYLSKKSNISKNDAEVEVCYKNLIRTGNTENGRTENVNNGTGKCSVVVPKNCFVCFTKQDSFTDSFSLRPIFTILSC